MKVLTPSSPLVSPISTLPPFLFLFDPNLTNRQNPLSFSLSIHTMAASVRSICLAFVLMVTLFSMANARIPGVYSGGPWQTAHATFYGGNDASGTMGILLLQPLSTLSLICSSAFHGFFMLFLVSAFKSVNNFKFSWFSNFTFTRIAPLVSSTLDLGIRLWLSFKHVTDQLVGMMSVWGFPGIYRWRVWLREFVQPGLWREHSGTQYRSV